MEAKWILNYEVYFSAAHYLPGHATCANMHGHNYKVTVSIGTQHLVDDMVIDFGLVKYTVRSVLKKIDHDILNHFVVIPTAEHIAEYLFKELVGALRDDSPERPMKLVAITVEETPGCSVTYSEEK